MAQGSGPWGSRSSRPGSARWRPLIWLALVLGGALCLWQLWRLFPNALADPGEQATFVQLCVMLILVASAIVYSRRFTAREALRNVAIWIGVVIVLGAGYVLYRQLGSELVPAYPSQAGPDVMVFTENRDGDFAVIGTVNGATVEFTVDTGASDIVLAPDDARRAGIDMAALNFNRSYETANGEGRGAAAVADTLQIGPVTLSNVPVSVNGAPMRSSLLGMAFLRRMRSFEMKGRKLYLRWR
ncbi:MAG: TIGR02281 family clan AA aspartic protease [Alphaproteobacteria bacterium]|nr:TIGR02281 family clan AA aspartic protease [Alphaproteobacteria bacterium]